jgi:holo-[acyl-carrier protein] synthase
MIENIGIGIDIVDVKRFQTIPYLSKKKFYNKIFLPSEIEYCLDFKNSALHFAGKYAAKEAVKKSIKEKLDVHDIEVVSISKVPKIKLRKRLPYKFLVSITHENNFAIAIVISEKTTS